MNKRRGMVNPIVLAMYRVFAANDAGRRMRTAENFTDEPDRPALVIMFPPMTRRCRFANDFAYPIDFLFRYRLPGR